MKSRWSDHGAREAIEKWASDHGEGFALRLYTAHLIGQEPDLVLHGGGNVSFKGRVQTLLGEEKEAVYVKASGSDLASLTPAGLPGVDLAYLRRLRSLDRLNDADMVNQIRTHFFDASAPTPSIETLVHAFLPPRFVDHSHADAVLALTNQTEGERLVREALGDRVAVLPYIRPGFELAKACADAYDAQPNVEGIVLLFHGLITFGDDARTAYERHIAIVDACEKYAESRIRAAGVTLREPATPTVRPDRADLAVGIAPILRGLLANPTRNEDRPYIHSVLQWRANDDILAFLSHPDARSLAESPPITGDHTIRTKPKPLFVEGLDSTDDDALRRQLAAAVAQYASEYRAYLERNGGPADIADPLPIVVLIPGVGVFCRGVTVRDAAVAADIIEHTLAVKRRAHAVGQYRGLAEDHIFDFEFRGIQRAKIESVPRPSGSGPGSAINRPLAGKIVAISGGAGAIGYAVAESCIHAGAHVALADRDEGRLEQVVQRLTERHRDGVALGVAMDVTDESSVRAGWSKIIRAFGGVDVIVPNAGVAHVAPIDELDPADFRRLMEVNAAGCLLFMQEGVRILKNQGLGGHVIINASKNVFAPGKDFAAYSASKAAAHQLGKVAAIELAPFGIRVNMINADAVFSYEDVESGLWADVGPQRMKSRGLSPEQLIEHYRERNLLKARIHGHHVGNAVVFFASNATPTTGATLPIDGGIIEAFPR